LGRQNQISVVAAGVSSLRLRPAVPFLTHLIAADRQEPQTCARRRAAPAEAQAAYAAHKARPVRSGVLLSRVV
jgi:hypothetical protein